MLTMGKVMMTFLRHVKAVGGKPKVASIAEALLLLSAEAADRLIIR